MKLALDGIGAVHDLVNDQHWSGAQLAAEARRRARMLARFCGPDDNRFVIAHANTPSFFADLFAVWEVGGCAVCVTPGLTAGELANVVRFVAPRALLVDAGGSDHAAGITVPLLCTATEPQPAADHVETSSGPSAGIGAGIGAGLDAAALMLFTSGTTGDPKGVLHSQRSLLSRLALNQAHIGSATLARSLCVLPTHFGHGLIGNCLTPLFSGGDVYLLHGQGVAGAAGLGETIDQHRISFMSSVPAFWKLALRVSPPPGGGSLQRVHIGSAPLSAELWQQVMAWCGTDQVANMYGITETANWVGGALASEFEPEDGLLGRVWGGHCAVLGEDGLAHAEGEGEILLQTPSLMNGYYRRDDLSAEVLRDGWYHSGDIGSIDAHGVLRMVGRNRYAINRGGIKVYPEELDLLLERHPAVVEACAFAMPDPISGDNVAIAVTLAAGDSQSDEAGLIDWLRDRIRPEAVPARLFLVNEIPKTERGKLNRDRVAAFCLQTVHTA